MTETCPQGVFCEKEYWQHQLKLGQEIVELAQRELERLGAEPDITTQPRKGW